MSDLTYETKDRIVSLAKLLREFSGEEDADIVIAQRISELAKDYVSMRTPKFNNEEVMNFITKDPGPTLEYLKFNLIGNILQRIDCTADIRMNANILAAKHSHYAVYAAELERAINFAKVTCSRHFESKTVDELMSDGEFLKSRMQTILVDLCKAITKLMVCVFQDYAATDDSDEKEDLAALGASCAMYMGMLGFSFIKNQWCPETLSQKKTELRIDNWENWGSPKCGRFFAYPIYMTWYEPVTGQVIESELSACQA